MGAVVERPQAPARPRLDVGASAGWLRRAFFPILSASS
jgi:hypothetical protein